MCSVSSRGTCHIWKLDDESEKKSKFIEGRRSISQIQIPDFNAKQQSKWFDPGAFFSRSLSSGPEAYQCAFTSDLKRLLIISIDGVYHRYRLWSKVSFSKPTRSSLYDLMYRLRLSKGQDPLHEHSVNFLSTT